MRRSHLIAVAALTCVLVTGTAARAAGGDAQPTWDEVRVALTKAPGHRPVPKPAPKPTPKPHPTPTPTPTPPPAPADSAAMTISVTIPDLSWAIDDPTASPGTLRAACHQVTGLDDETAAPLAACLAHVRGDTGHGHDDGHHASTPPGHQKPPCGPAFGRSMPF